MSPRLLFVATVFVCIVNGILSPALFIVLAVSPLWAPTIVGPSPQVILLLSSLIVSTGTLLIAGVPAALYERFAGLEHSNRISMGMWLVAALFLTFPAFQTLL